MRRFADRLAALERLEAATVLGPLTVDDCYMLRDQIVLHNVTLNAAGQVVRGWRTGSADYTAQLDIAIKRSNVVLAALADPLRTTEALDKWLEHLQPNAPDFLCVRADDIDRLDDPAVLARYGLTVDQLPAKIYVGFCTCCWDGDGRHCPVCVGE